MHFTPYVLLLATTALAAPLATNFDDSDDTCYVDEPSQSAQDQHEPALPSHYTSLAAEGTPTALVSLTMSGPPSSTIKPIETAGVSSDSSPIPSTTLAASQGQATVGTSSRVSVSSASKTSSTTPHETSALPSGKYPFKRMVAFGDNLSDNGNGSYAHRVTDGDKDNKVYGFGTWTNGPVAVSYLSDLISTPLTTDYAFGHADGGSKFGATIDNAYTQSTANAPSSKDQIASYTGSNPTDVASTLHFLWIGANDITFPNLWVDKPTYPTFAKEFSTRLAAQVQTLLDAGSESIFVPNLYPRHIAPSAEFMANTPETVANLGSVIKEANDAIAAALEGFGKKVLVYDVYSFMLEVNKNHDGYGIDYISPHFIDGHTQAEWDEYMAGGGDKFYWMQYNDMTTRVHKLVAEDMEKAIADHEWL